MLSWARPARLAAVGLTLLLAAVLAAHLAFRAYAPPPILWGDEPGYLALAREDARAGERSLLPGTLRFDAQPQLGSRVIALVADPADDDLTVRRVQLLQTLLLLGIVASVWAQARLLRLGHGASLLAATLVGTFPWLGFHVHGLWPEVLHAFLFAVALILLLVFLERGRWSALAAAGPVLGAALLTKGALVPLLPVFAGVVGWTAFRRRGERWETSEPALEQALPARRRVARALAAPLLLAATTAAVVLPQMAANARAGHGWRLAANRWWNLELGLTLPVDAPRWARVQARRNELEPGLERWLPALRVSARYQQAAETPRERERLARERTLAHLREEGVLHTAGRQLEKLARLLVAGESSFEQSLGHWRRWDRPPPAWLSALRLPARVFWYLLLVASAIGMARARARSPGWRLLTLSVLVFFLALALVPVKLRFLLPITPLLCLFAAASVARLPRALGAPARRSPSARGLRRSRGTASPAADSE